MKLHRAKKGHFKYKWVNFNSIEVKCADLNEYTMIQMTSRNSKWSHSCVNVSTWIQLTPLGPTWAQSSSNSNLHISEMHCRWSFFHPDNFSNFFYGFHWLIKRFTEESKRKRSITPIKRLIEGPILSCFKSLIKTT